MENKIRKIIKEQIKKLSEMKVTDKDGKDVTSDMIKKIEKCSCLKGAFFLLF